MKKSILLVILWLAAGCAGAVATTPAPGAVSPAQSAITPGAPGALPLTWGGHALSGHLLVIQYHESGASLIRLDLATGNYETLFQAPTGSLLNTAALSPDGKQLILAYAPPMREKSSWAIPIFTWLRPDRRTRRGRLNCRQDSSRVVFRPVLVAGWENDRVFAFLCDRGG